MSEYYLYSTDDSHKGIEASILWWRPNSAGYTSDLNRAGVYSEEEGARIVESTTYDDVPALVMVPAEIARAAAWNLALVSEDQLRAAMKAAALAAEGSEQ